MMSLLRIIAGFCRRYGFLVLCFFCVCPVFIVALADTCFAQNGEERTFRRLNHLDGLSNDEIFCIYQDRNGIMWFGTPDGLNSYDGNKFTVYRHREGDGTSLPQNIVTHITEDARGNMWVGTKDYCCRFIPKGDGGIFVSYQLPTRVQFHYARAILDAGDGRTMYVALGAGVFALDKNDSSVRSIVDERLLGERPEFSGQAVLDAQKNLWISCVKGLFVYERQTERLRRISDHCIVNAMPRLDRDGHFWYGTTDTLFVFDPSTERVIRTIPKSRFSAAPGILENKNIGYLLCQSYDGLIWFQFRQTAWTINPSTTEIKEHTASVRNVLNNSGLQCGFSDRTGVLWLGDNVRGLAVWSPYKPKFRLWRHNPANANSLSHDYIRGIWEDDNRTAWVCTQFGGLNRINRETGGVRRYQYQAGGSRKPQTGLISNDLWGILPLGKDAAGHDRIWLYKELFCQEMNTATERFRLLPIIARRFMLQDREGVIWTMDSLVGKPSFLGTVRADRVQFLPKKTMAKNIVRLDAALQDRRGRLWFALFSPQVLRYDKRQQTWDTLRLNPPLSRADMICSMTEDRAGNVWITTKGDGIYRCDTNDRVTNITEKDGLPNNNVYGIFEDSHGMIWTSGDKGVVMYNPMSKKFRQYSPQDGLQGWEFNRMAFHQTRGGYIYFGGTDGLNLFHPDSLRDNPHPPRVRMTAIHVMGKPLQSDTATGDLRSVNVLHESNTLSFEFAALDFTAPELNRYSWRLDGFDKDWTEPSPKHETKYTNLSPGDYIFRVKACNSDGVWSENGIVLFVTVQPAWYQRWWFLLLCGLALIGGVVMIVRVRVRGVEVQNRLLEVEVHKRTKELREANSEIKRQMEVQDAQAREIELANSELDLTLQDLKTTQTQLVQSERMNAIGMLAAGVMHEINNPNAIAYSAITQARSKLEEMVTYFLSLLDDESKESAEVRKYQQLSNDALSRLELAAEGAGRVKTIVANLQGMTKHQEEGGKTGNLVAELASTFSLFRMQFHTVEIVADTSPAIFIRANFGEINQVFLNLLVNAAQAGATRITMTATQTDSMVVLRMTDNGKGMSAKTASQIFEPFFTTKAAGNSGLGLSISKQIIERHGGEIECESEPDKGTTFIVRLPIVHV